jgi:hypothetical protein
VNLYCTPQMQVQYHVLATEAVECSSMQILIKHTSIHE